MTSQGYVCDISHFVQSETLLYYNYKYILYGEYRIWPLPVCFDYDCLGQI